jgi:calnexin
MQNNIMFDNIYIGHSVEDAAKLAEESWKPKHAAEVLLEEADKPKEEDKPKAPGDLKFADDPVLFIREKLNLFLTLAKKDPIEAIKFVPEAAAGLAAVVATIGFILFTALGGGSAPAVKKAASDVKDKAKAAKDKAVDAATTGADTAKAEVTKRTTRSQQS